MQFEEDNEVNTYVGSGVLCYDFMIKKYFVLTCAHNFVSIVKGQEKKILNAKKFTYFHRRESLNKFYCETVGQSFIEDPEYI